MTYDSALDRYRLMVMTDSPAEEVREEVTLKLGIFFEEDGFDSFLAQFNASNSFVKIEPIYYDRFDEYDKESKTQVRTALEQLNLDMISGNAPDIAEFMEIPRYLAEKGAFADMYDLMDSDLDRDDFLPSILEACETRGALTSLPTTFSVRSLICADKYSPVKNQSFDDMIHTFNNAPEGKLLMPSSDSELLIDILSYSDYAASYRDGEYRVNGDNIRNVLELCGTMPDPCEIQDAAYSPDSFVFREIAGWNFGDLAQTLDSAGGSVTFAGFPTEKGCGTVAVPVHSVAVLNTCADKAAAWEFVKRMYDSPAIVNGINSGFPVTKKAFDAQCDTLRKNMPDKAEQLIDAVTSARTLGSGIDNSLFSIIMEEASRYFNGEYTAEQAAEYIKSRTEIYVSERS